MDAQGLLLKRRGKGYIKAFPDKDGYLKYSLQQPSGTYNTPVHRHVWRALKGEIPTGYSIDHINNDRADNRIENLQLMTPEDNARKGNVRQWVVMDPEGNVHEVTNLLQFAVSHNLHKSHLYAVANGTYKSTGGLYKGWNCYAIYYSSGNGP